MAWLSGWDHRMKWTADSSDTAKVTATITKPSIPVFFGSSVGKDSDDNTAIFDEIGSNWDEMAITYGDTEELYVEVEDWDSVNSGGVVWIGDNTDSSWTVVSGTDRTGWIYYKDGNTNAGRVGAIGSTDVGERVWDSSHEMVQHMVDENATGDTVLDSTSNDIDGAKTSADNPEKAAGLIGGLPADTAQDFNGSDGIGLGDDIWTDSVGTIEAWIEMDAVGVINPIFSAADDVVVDDMLRFTVYYDGTVNNRLAMQLYRGPGSNFFTYINDVTVDTGRHHVCVSSNGSKWKLYYDGVPGNLTDDYIDVDAGEWFDDLSGSNVTFRIGHQKTSAAEVYADGVIDEMRVSSSQRTDAWIKANYYFQTDDLLYFGSEERLFHPYIIFFS